MRLIAFKLQLLSQSGEAALARLDDEQRARLFSSLALLAILGFFLLGFVWFLGRAVRRYTRYDAACETSRLRAELDLDDWARKPIVPEVPDGPAAADASEEER